jgi:hypothetical protein
LDARLVVHI